jgi:hypothetical protein
MTDTDDTLIDKIRAAMQEIRENSETPKYIMATTDLLANGVILPTEWLDVNDIDPLIPVAAERFSVAEDDVTYEMIFAVHAERLKAH